MRTLILLSLCFGLGQLAFISENVVFDKVNTISTTRSKWLVTFLIDLQPFEQFMTKLSNDILWTAGLAQQILRHYDKPGKENFMNTFSNLKHKFKLLMDTHNSLSDIFKDYRTLRRQKRAVLPIVGKALNFLFGTVTEADLSSIKTNIRTLAENQNEISHVLAENLSILNVTRLEVSQNRQAINTLTKSLSEIDFKLDNITQELEKQIIELETFVQFYIQIDLITSELELLIQKAIFYSEHIKSQLEMLSLGHLSPSTITPGQLKALLTEIKDRLPKYLEMTEDPSKNLWFFYRFLTCTTVLYDSKILVIISVPLLDSNTKFQVYRAYNLPMPMHQNKTKNLISMVAKFDIDIEYFAVNAERSKYVLFTGEEIQKCINPFTKFCKIISPVYPINLSKNCVISLFMKKQGDIDTYCRVLVEPSTILPMANYISSGSWLITTNGPLDFAIACHSSKYQTTFNKRIYPPLSILTLNETCSATNDYMTLLPFYNRQSTYGTFDDSYNKLIKNYNITSRKLWKPFHQSLPKFNLTELPKELKDIKQIPMDSLINRLKNLQRVQTDFDMPNWVHSLIYFVIALLVGIFIFILCKYRKKLRLMLPCSTKSESGEKLKNFTPKYGIVGQLVSAKTGSDGSTLRDVASAPMLGNPKDETHNNVYPVLNLPLHEH